MTRIEQLLAALLGAGVRFVVVGGVAVVLHGHARLTADLDVIVDLDAENVLRALEVLASEGLRPRLPVDAADFADAERRQEWVRDRGLTVFTLADPDDPLRAVDVFADPPEEFDTLAQRAKQITVGSLTIPVASIPDLIRMKERSGRPLDRADIDALQALRDYDANG